MAGELAALTGAYWGDVVTVSTTGYLFDVIGVKHESDTHEHDQHSHAAHPLHEHKH